MTDTFPTVNYCRGRRKNPVQCSSRISSSCRPNRRSWRLCSAGKASVASPTGGEERPTPVAPRRFPSPTRRLRRSPSAASSRPSTSARSCLKPRPAAATAPSALLRRQGLYSSHLTTWRRQKEQGELDALPPKKRGRKSSANPLTEENQRLRKKCPSEPPPRTGRAHYRHAKKVSSLLGISLPEVKSGEENL